MMNILEEAIIYATIMHQGRVRKFTNSPFILHPLEVAEILASMTDDIEVITAGILHDIVEDTDGTLEEIEKRFGKRVADLVASESENDYPGEDMAITWKRRKEESVQRLKNSTDSAVKMLWLADKCANMRSLAAIYSEMGEELWESLNQKDPEEQHWYYRTIAETVELELNRTGAFKEFIKHINFIWPGSFDSEKTRFKKYREVSVDGCPVVGRGAKGEVYRYNDELVIKVFNQNNTYQDVEKEIAMSRKAFILGIPTAISFGIVSVGKRYGAIFELLNADTISRHIARAPRGVGFYAKIMAGVARKIHSIEVSDEDGFSDALDRIRNYINDGIEYENSTLAEKCMKLVDAIPYVNTLIHGDFHTGNVFIQNGEPIIIDLDRIGRGHPIVELSDLYFFYVILGEDDPLIVEKFMGFSYKTAMEFFRVFLQHYLGTDDQDKIMEVTEKASLLGYVRIVLWLHTKGNLTEHEIKMKEEYLARIEQLTDRLDSLIW